MGSSEWRSQGYFNGEAVPLLQVIIIMEEHGPSVTKYTEFYKEPRNMGLMWLLSFNLK